MGLAKLKVLGAVTIGAIFAGCNLLGGGQSASQPKPTPTPTPTPAPEGTAEQLSNIITSGQSYRCSYSSEQGDVTMFVKGENIRVEGAGITPQGQENQGAMIKKDNTVYIWSEAQNQGVSYDVSSHEDMQQESEQNLDQWADIQKWAQNTSQQYNVDCEQTPVSNDLFNPPDDIEFQDLSSFMENARQMQESLQEGASPEQLQDKMGDLEEMIQGMQTPGQ